MSDETPTTAPPAPKKASKTPAEKAAYVFAQSTGLGVLALKETVEQCTAEELKELEDAYDARNIQNSGMLAVKIFTAIETRLGKAAQEAKQAKTKPDQATPVSP